MMIRLGTIQVYYSENLLEEDVDFLSAIKKNIWMAAVVTLLLSILFSLLFTKKLAIGFEKLSNAVNLLRNHHFQVRLPIEELKDEMKPMGQSINELADTLSKEQMLRKQFTHDFAHEIRTPLTALRSQIEAYQDEIWEPTQERLQQSHDELMRMVGLVNELETLLAAENPQLKLDIMDMSVSELLVSINNRMNASFNEKGVHLIVKEPKKDHWFKGDQNKVNQILTNIMNNALKYTLEGKSVWVDIEEDESYVTFMVKDEGIGNITARLAIYIRKILSWR